MAERDGPAALERVLVRWLPPESDRPTVAVVGLPGSGRDTLTRVLRREVPQIRLVDGLDAPADLVLLVFDAAASIGREELGLVAAAAARGADLRATLTRIDAHHGWRTVLERDESLLDGSAHGAVTGPIMPVSALTGAGLAGLRDTLDAAVARPHRPVPNADRVARARALALDTVAELRRDEEGTRMRQRRAALIADRDGPRSEASACLRREVALARVDIAHLVGERVRSTTAARRGHLENADRADLAGFGPRFREEVAELTVHVDAAVSDVLCGLAQRVAGVSGPVGGPDRPPPTVPLPPLRHRGLEDRMVVFVGASAGLGAGRFLVAPMSGVAFVDLVAVPVTLMAGVGAAWWLTRIRGHLADRVHLRQWLVETMTQVRSDLEQRSLARLVEAEAEVVEAVHAAHRARVRAADEPLAEVDRAARESAARTAGRIAAVERDLAVLDRECAEPAVPVARPSS